MNDKQRELLIAILEYAQTVSINEAHCGTFEDDEGNNYNELLDEYEIEIVQQELKDITDNLR